MRRRAMVLFAAIWLLSASAALAQDPLFAPAVNYAVGTTPASVFAADFDNDGYKDLAVANWGSNNVSVLMNTGYGTFPPTPVNHVVESNPYSVFACDFNGDGHNDLAVANEWFGYQGLPGSVSILMNNGLGTFVADSNYVMGNWPVSVFACDLDGDGDNDLAVANHYSADVSIMMNNGLGVFVVDSNYSLGTYGYDGVPYAVLACDLDADGDSDLVVPTVAGNYPHPGHVRILMNNGDGTFVADSNYVVGNAPKSVFVCDLDSDGDNDLAVANDISNNVSILMNNGLGAFVVDSNYSVGSNPGSVFACDLDGDGDKDLSVANYSSHNVSILRNNGDGTFQAAINYDVGDGPMSVFACDLDGDGDSDLAVANHFSDNVSVLLNLSARHVSLDIKPGSCPNPLNVTSGHDLSLGEDAVMSSKITPDAPPPPPAIVPVAILGTEDFDVSAIVPASVRLEGVPALRWKVQDVATPVGDNAAECECNTLGADGFLDLTLRFGRNDLIKAIGEVQQGDVIPLTISGELIDGAAIEGQDCMVIVGGRLDPVAASSTGMMNSYPNPFNPTTTIAYSISQSGPVALEIYNVLGEKVRTLVDQFQTAGDHEVTWDSRNDHGEAVSSGIYFYRLRAGDLNETKKMVLMK